MVEVEDVVIVGAGIAGLATAVALKRIGVTALVLERSDELRATGAALTLFPNAWLALHALGVSHKLTSLYPSVFTSFVTNLETGSVQQVNLGRTNRDKRSGPRTVHRKSLLEALAEEILQSSIRFSSKITMIETEPSGDSSLAVVHIADGTIIKAKVLIGCDGVNSVVANWLGLAAPIHSGRSAIRGLAVYKEGHGLKEVNQFVGAGKRVGVVPINDLDIYWFFTSSSPPKGTDQFLGEPELIQRELLENYAKDMPNSYTDIVKHSDLSSLTWAPLMLRLPWKVLFGRLSKQNVTVAGDAMHPMTPDLGQGGCSALEDAVILGRCIGESLVQNGGIVPGKVERALANYAAERRWRVAWLITGSYLSGWVQQGGSSWVVKVFRDAVFYRFLLHRIANVMDFDCGKLPVVDRGMEANATAKPKSC